MQLADDLLAAARQVDSSLELKFNKFYIGLSKSGQPFNFVVFRPRKSSILCEIKLPQSDETTEKVDQGGFETLPYDTRYSSYRLVLGKQDIAQHANLLLGLFQDAYNLRSA